MSSKKPTLQILPDPCPGLPIERGPEEKGVGRWVPEHKHRLLTEYLHGTREAWKKWPNRVFIDPFCGPGRIQVKGETFTRDGGAAIAWCQSVESKMPFTHMLVGDINAERADACAQRLKALGAPAVAIPGPASTTTAQMAAMVPKGALCMAYVDPYNLELLSFSIIEALAHLKVDFAVHFSTMDLQRNVEFEFDPTRARFDETAPGWRQNVDVLRTPKRQVGPAFFNYWQKKVQGLGFAFSTEMPLVRNDSNHAIYRLVFFARHNMATRIWGDIARGPNRQLGLDLEA